MSKLINGVASEYDMPMPTTITTITKEQLDGLYLDMLHINKEKTDMIKKLETEILRDKQMYQMQIDLLQQRIDKIINAFDNENLQKYYYGLSYEFEINQFKEDLLNILKGDKDE